MLPHKTKIYIIGAGLAGLSCAYYLEQKGLSSVILEAEESYGGRVKTDTVDGFLLDRGFQIVLTGYPEVQALFEPQELDLGTFPSGAMIYFEGEWFPFYNVFQSPLQGIRELNLPFLKIYDLAQMSSFYLKSIFKDNDQTVKIESSTYDYLRENGVSEDFIQYFIRPFFGGVFLDPTLNFSFEAFLRLLKYFVNGNAALPFLGMQDIPKKLMQKLKSTSIRLGQKVMNIQNNHLILNNGEEIEFDRLIIATDGPHAFELKPDLPPLKSQSTLCLYFAIQEDLLKVRPLIYLNGGEGPINNLSFNNLVQSSYAPKGQLLVSVTVIEDKWRQQAQLEKLVREQLQTFFNIDSVHWRFLRSYEIKHALPNQSPKSPLYQDSHYFKYSPIYLCGEYVDQPSINGALRSGRVVADLVDQSLKSF